jgi:hypothetical protein
VGIVRIIAIVLLLVGIAAMLMGAGVIAGTPLSGRGNWLVIGAVTAVVGYIALHWCGIRRHSGS